MRCPGGTHYRAQPRLGFLFHEEKGKQRTEVDPALMVDVLGHGRFRIPKTVLDSCTSMDSLSLIFIAQIDAADSIQSRLDEEMKTKPKPKQSRQRPKQKQVELTPLQKEKEPDAVDRLPTPPRQAESATLLRTSVNPSGAPSATPSESVIPPEATRVVEFAVDRDRVIFGAWSTQPLSTMDDLRGWYDRSKLPEGVNLVFGARIKTIFRVAEKPPTKPTAPEVVH